jgi:predicted PurR-regulated permease PerM
MALILGTPMRKIEQLFELINRKSKAKKKLPEKAIIYISLILTYILAIVAAGLVIGILIPAVSDSVKEIIATVKRVWPDIVSFLKDKGVNTAELEKLLRNVNLESIMLSFTSNFGNVFDTVIHSVNGIITLVANIVTAVIFSIYLLSNKRKLKNQSEKLVKAYLPEKKASRTQYVIDLTVTTFSKFFSGQCLEAIILGLIFFIILSITGFPYAPVISLIIGITAFIPYVGAFIGCAIGVLLILMDAGIIRALIFIAVFLVVQQLENNLIYPRVVGTTIGLPAIWTFAALIVGGAVYGVVGMLVFIPVTSIIYTLIRNDVHARLKAKEASRIKPEEAEDTSDSEQP